VIVSGPSSLLVIWVTPKPAATPTAITSRAISATGIRQLGGRR
jgi:hypothetical protein